MKTLVIILIVYINYVLSFEIESTVNYTLKKYPKKVIPGHVQFINSGKYVKPRQTKKNDVIKTYTAFPRIHNVQKSVPESPLFPFETANEPKTRVKKVLHDYSGPGIRNKRSVSGEHESAKMRELSKTPNARGVNKKTHKSGDEMKARKKHARKPNARNRNTKKGGKMSKMAGKRKRKSVKNTGRKGKRHTARSVRKKGKIAQGRRNKRKVSRRLIAARDAKIEEYPYVVSIQKNGEHWCAGALLNPRLIITTANCMWKARRISKMKVRAGSQYVDRGGQIARISDVMKHPGWGIRRDPDYDLALALLDRNLKFSDKVHGVDLPNRKMQPAFDDAWVTSWGAERRDGVYDPSPMTLQVYHARLMNREKCNNITHRFAVTVTSNFICLAQTGRRSPCTRDTGAPAVSDGVLWGLASWGIRKLCGTERFPAMFSYTASDANMDFIMNATHVLMSDQRYYPYPDRLPAH